MKKSEVKHILDTAKTDGPELRFIGYLDRRTGETILSNDLDTLVWDNIRHLTGNLYYAWNENQSEYGCVYVGTYEPDNQTK